MAKTNSNLNVLHHFMNGFYQAFVQQNGSIDNFFLKRCFIKMTFVSYCQCDQMAILFLQYLPICNKYLAKY